MTTTVDETVTAINLYQQTTSYTSLGLEWFFCVISKLVVSLERSNKMYQLITK